jgi:flagellar motor switch protein FliN
MQGSPAVSEKMLEGVEEHQNGSADDFSGLAHVPVTLQVQLGTATLQLSELMKLSSQMEVPLDEALGEPVLVFVNGCKIAKGELFVQEERGNKLGVRITELLVKGA